MQYEGRLSILFITLEGGIHFLVVYPSELCDKMSFEYLYKQSDAIKFSSCLILSKQDTKKPIRSWVSFQYFLLLRIYPLKSVYPFPP